MLSVMSSHNLTHKDERKFFPEFFRNSVLRDSDESELTTDTEVSEIALVRQMNSAARPRRGGTSLR